MSSIASKKRKMSLFDSTSPSFDQNIDLMQLEKPSIHLGGFHKQILRPTITIANAHPPRPKELSVVEFNTSWEIQKTLVTSIFANQTNKNFNYLTSARLSESLCRFGRSEALYGLLVKEIRNHVQQLKLNIAHSTDDLLINVKNSWETFGSQLTVIKNVFIELDRSYVLPKTKFASIIQLGKHIFSEIVFDSVEFCNNLVDKVLYLIELDRDGKHVDKRLIQSIVNIFIELSYYNRYFEPYFLTKTIAYYKHESSRLINTLSIPEYIQHAQHRREEELEQRILTYLDIRTKQALDKAITHELIYSKADTIIKQGFTEMMDLQLTKPLEIIYDVLLHSQIDTLRHAFGNYIKTTGVTLIQQPQNDNIMISSLLKFKKKLDRILKDCFKENSLFANVLKENCEYFINTRGNKPAELLAKFFDSKLKISNKKRNADNDFTSLDEALVLFRFLQSKDAFEVYYKRFLAKRLLLNKSESKSMESHVLEKLRVECGYEFTKNLESMFHDMEISHDLNTDFKKYEQNAPRMPMNVKVITQAIWPSYPIADMLLPEKMVTSQKLYDKFYASRFNGRKLIWQNSLSSCILNGHFSKGQIEISCNLAQAILLTLFNDKEVLSFIEIQQATGLVTKELIGLLCSLVSKPYNLIMNESGESITPHATFRFNSEFEFQTNKIKLPLTAVNQITEEQKEVEKVQINRQYRLEAAIMRIMKSKRKLHHNDLVNLLVTESNYPIEANDVKKRIESLIERDYMTRHKNDNSLYIYQS